MSSTPSRSLRFPRLAALLLAAVAFVAACSDSTGPKTPDGIYALSAINGKSLPYRLFADTGFTVDVTRSAISLNVDGSFYVTFTSEERVEGYLSTYVDSVGGIWKQDGDVISITMSDSTKQSATWVRKTLALVDSSSVPTMSYMYLRP